MMQSAYPFRIVSAPDVIAWFDDAHARLTVNAGTFGGRPASIVISRATFGAGIEGSTVPKIS